MFTSFTLPNLPRPAATDDSGNTAIVPVIVDTFIGADGEVFTRETSGMHAWREADDDATRAGEYGARHLTRVIGEACLITGEATLYVCR